MSRRQVKFISGFCTWQVIHKSTQKRFTKLPNICRFDFQTNTQPIFQHAEHLFQKSIQRQQIHVPKLIQIQPSLHTLSKTTTTNTKTTCHSPNNHQIHILSQTSQSINHHILSNRRRRHLHLLRYRITKESSLLVQSSTNLCRVSLH